MEPEVIIPCEVKGEKPERAAARTNAPARVAVRDDWKPTDGMARFVEAYSNNGYKRIKQSCEEAGITYQSWLRWKRDPAFVKYLQSEQDRELQMALPTVKASLLKLAQDGDMRAIRMVLEIAGEIGNTKKPAGRSLSFTQIVNTYSSSK